jgi:hypothetical protein
LPSIYFIPKPVKAKIQQPIHEIRPFQRVGGKIKEVGITPTVTATEIRNNVVGNFFHGGRQIAFDIVSGPYG